MQRAVIELTTDEILAVMTAYPDKLTYKLTWLGLLIVKGYNPTTQSFNHLKISDVGSNHYEITF